MYHSSTALNRHRVVSADGYWAPGGTSSTTSVAATINSRRETSFQSSNGGYVTNATHSNPIDSNSSSSSYFPSSPTAARPRRSHRPRGCRGGRKNRKVKSSVNQYETHQQPNASMSCHYSHDESNLQYMGRLSYSYNEPSLPSSSNVYGTVVAMKGDLSPYQHLRLTSKPWKCFNRENSDSVPNGGFTTNLHESQSKQHQMLPPPVPSALFDSHRHNIELMMNSRKSHISGSGLKMLPSFDDDDDDIEDTDDGCDDYYNQYYNDDDYSADSIEVGMSIPKLSQTMGLVPQTTPSRPKSVSIDYDMTSSSRSIHALVAMSHQHNNGSSNDNCEATVDTCSSRSRSSSSDESAIIRTNDAKLVATHSNMQQQQQQQQQNIFSSLMKHPPPTKSIPVLLLPQLFHSSHIITATPQPQKPPSGGGYGSLFVTSPRSFLFGIGSFHNHPSNHFNVTTTTNNNNNNNNKQS